jgi:AraC family transcriptional regulator, carnitine catabolism transcriptional activator
LRSVFDIVFALVPGFSMIALYSALEPLRVANRFGGELFRWRFVSLTGEAVTASNGIPVSVEGPLAQVGRPNLAVVCSSYDHHLAMTPAMRSALRRLDGAGVWLGGLDTGAILLADAGLLDGRRATCHWETLGAMREDFPRVHVSDEIFVVDGPRLTASGGTAPLDMMIYWIGSLHGQALATRVADTLVHARYGGDPGGARIAARTRFGTDDPCVLAAITAMEEHLEDVLRLEDVAGVAGVSPRQLERRFRRALGMGPMRFYLGLRLERAERLLTYSRMGVRDAGLAAGFASLAQFSRAYKARFGLAPSQHRRQAVPG